MIYLTQVLLDFATATRLGLRDSYDWHQAVWQAFPGRDGMRRDFLTRLDALREGFRLLIVSPVEPVRPEWCPAGAGQWASKPIPENYFSRDRYAFQLCANPTRKVVKLAAGGNPTKNGRRIPLRTHEELLAWLRRKGEHGGFSVDEDGLYIFPRGRGYFERRGMRGLHSAVEFRGILEVDEPAKFHEAFTHGIGPAKAFGFGLLVIVPVT
jgi:CRISPR system Cascade subunit CasE